MHFNDNEALCSVLSDLKVNTINLVRVVENQRTFTRFSHENKNLMQNIQKSLSMNKMETKPFVANYFNADSLVQCLANSDIQVNYDFKAKALKPEQFFEKMNKDIQNENQMEAWIYIRMNDKKVSSKNRKLAGADPTPTPTPDPTLQLVNCGPGTVSGILVLLFIFFFMWMYMMAVDGLSGPVEFNKNLLKVGKEF